MFISMYHIRYGGRGGVEGVHQVVELLLLQYFLVFAFHVPVVKWTSFILASLTARRIFMSGDEPNRLFP